MQVHTHLLMFLRFDTIDLPSKMSFSNKGYDSIEWECMSVEWGLCMYHFLQRKVQHANTV